MIAMRIYENYFLLFETKCFFNMFLGLSLAFFSPLALRNHERPIGNLSRKKVMFPWRKIAPDIDRTVKNRQSVIGHSTIFSGYVVDLPKITDCEPNCSVLFQGGL
jgi:hypothetical protein